MENETETSELYECNYSTKADSLTITFRNTQFHEHIKHRLEIKYNFYLNKNGNGYQTTFEHNGEKCVITVYFNRTLFVQGKPCRVWKSEVYDEFLQNYCLTNDCSMSKSYTMSASPESSPRRSPLIASLSRIVNSLRSPGRRMSLREHENNTPTKRFESSFSSVNDNTLTGQISRSNSLSDSCPVAMATQSSLNTNECSPVSANEETIVKRVQTKQSKRKSKQNKQVNNEETHVKEVTEGQLVYDELKKANEILRKKNNEQTEKAGKLESEINSLKTSLKTQSERSDKLTNEVKSLRNEISAKTAKVLVSEEECTKLKQNVEQLLREKADLVTQLIKSQVTSETLDSKLQHVTTSLEMKFDAEMTNLKSSVLKELNEMKSIANTCTTPPTSGQSHTPVNVKIPASTPVNSNVNTNQPSSSTMGRPSGISNNRESNTDPKTRQLKAFVAGDSITKRLSAKKMSDQNLTVKIKSNSGGRIESVEKSITEASGSDKQFIQDVDLVLLHVGTNNVTDGDSAEMISSKLENAVIKIKSTCHKAKVVISSILPRKTERVIVNIINTTNGLLSDMCTKTGCYFLDNDKTMFKNGRPDFSLFHDNVHLNLEGGKIFGTSLRNTMESLLGLYQPENKKPEVIDIDNSDDDSINEGNNQHFQMGRYSGGSQRGPFRTNNFGRSASVQNKQNNSGYNQNWFQNNNRYNSSYQNSFYHNRNNQNVVYMPVPVWGNRKY